MEESSRDDEHLVGAESNPCLAPTAVNENGRRVNAESEYKKKSCMHAHLQVFAFDLPLCLSRPDDIRWFFWYALHVNCGAVQADIPTNIIWRSRQRT